MNACLLWVCVARGACKFQTASLVVLLFLHLTRFWLFQHEPVYCYKFQCANWLQVLITNRMHSLNAMDLSCGVCLTRGRMNHLNVCQTSSVTAQWQLIGCWKMQHIFSYRTSWEMHSPKILGDTFNQCSAALNAFHRSIWPNCASNYGTNDSINKRAKMHHI